MKRLLFLLIFLFPVLALGAELQSPYITNPEVSGTAAPSAGSIFGVASAPTVQGTNYTVNDEVYVTTGSQDAVVKCTTVVTGYCTAVSLVHSGSFGYATGSGQATTIKSCSNAACAGLTINVSAVGLSKQQVMGTFIRNTGQGEGAVQLGLPTATQGLGFVAYVGTAPGAYTWKFTANPGTQNGASGDIIYLDKTAGTAAQSIISPASPAVGDAIVCYTFRTNTTGPVYSWKCKATDGTWTQGP